MAVENILKERFEEVSCCGKPCLFTNSRLDRDSIPTGLFVYDVRHDDECQGIPCEIASYILVNHWGTILCAEEIPLTDGGCRYLDVSDDGDTWYDWNYEENSFTIPEYLARYNSLVKELKTAKEVSLE